MFLFQWFIIVLGLSFLLSCRSKPNLPTTNPTSSSEASPLSSSSLSSPSFSLPTYGENCCAQFIGPSSRQFVFLSRQRTRHSHFQIYAYDMDKHQEKRLSFHDGEDHGVSLDPKGEQMVYASLTDSTKENPAFLRKVLHLPSLPILNIGFKPLWKADAYELYLAKADGSEVQRLTSYPGFDGEPRFFPDGQSLVYTSVIKGRASLMKMSLDHNSPTPKILLQDEAQLGEPDPQLNKKQILFVKYAQDLQSSQIWVSNSKGKQAKALTSGPGLKLSPRWFPHGRLLIFSSNQSDPKSFNLYTMQADGQCLQQWTHLPGNEWLPQPSPNGKSVIWTNELPSGQLQLQVQDFIAPSCP